MKLYVLVEYYDNAYQSWIRGVFDSIEKASDEMHKVYDEIFIKKMQLREEYMHNDYMCITYQNPNEYGKIVLKIELHEVNRTNYNL